MAIFLGKNAYGNNVVNLSKIIRHPGYHEFRNISVNILLQGDFETAQHYLYFSAENIPNGATQLKCTPHIRSKATNERLC